MVMDIKWFNEFDAKIRLLKRRAGNTPSRIDWLVTNDADARRLIGTLYYRKAQFESRLQSGYFLANVPRWFLDRYREHSEKFGPAVDRAYGPLSIRALFEDPVDGIPAEEVRHPEGKPAREEGEDMTAVSLLDGLEELELVFEYVRNMSQDSKYEEELLRGVEAWEYLTEKIGLDVAGVALRWHKLPRALVPSGTHGSVLDLLREAAKAYVFGLPAAAIALCRATCDLVLRQYYVTDDQLDDEGDEKPLGGKDGMIFMAEKKFEFLKGLNLRKHVNAANRILHDYAKSHRVSDAENDAAREFLETLRTVIERVPAHAPKPR